MKYFLSILALFLALNCFSQIEVYIPDDNFRAALIDLGHDLNGDSIIHVSEIRDVDSLNLNRRAIRDLTGIEGFENLRIIECANNPMLHTLKLVNSVKLEKLDCTDGNLSSLDLSNCSDLKYFIGPYNNLKTLDVSQNPKLEVLDLNSNRTIELDLSNNPLLKELYLNQANLENLDISNNHSLEKLQCWTCTSNPLNDPEFFDLNNNPELKYLAVNQNGITELDLTQNPLLEFLDIGLTDIQTIDLSSNSRLKELSGSICSLTELDVSQCVELETMDIGSWDISEIDLTNNPNLKKLSLGRSLQQLDVSKNLELEFLSSNSYTLQEIDLTNNSKLKEFTSVQSQLKKVDFSNNPLLEKINIDSNRELAQIDICNCPQLKELHVGRNKLTSLDISKNPLLETLTLGGDFLQLVNFANGSILNSITANPLAGMRSIRYVCVDEDEVTWMENTMENVALVRGFTNINTGCALPKDINNLFNLFSGNIYYDEDGKCDDDSPTVDEVIAFDFSGKQNQFSHGYSISTQESFSYPLPNGNYSLIPKPKNSDLFKIDPDTIYLELMGMDTVTQDFCISPNGSPTALVEINIIPDTRIARPGFEFKYRIVYSNVGNIPVSGEIAFQYDPELMMYLRSEPMADELPGELFFRFDDLRPFEKNEACVSFLLNSPMDDPPLDTGDEIDICAYPIIQDIVGNRNIGLKCITQEIRNSFDPNDKRCLQGNIVMDTSLISPVDYMIRFENTGTAEAVNVTIEDEIDTEIFDINTFRLIESSHPVQAYANDKRLTFYFKDIYLPFDDANNDGHVVFEIKTWPEVMVGDSLKNNADILFDFNYPIVADTARSYIATDMDLDGFNNLVDCDDENPQINPDAEEIPNNGIDEDCDGLDGPNQTGEIVDKVFQLYPNPVSSELHINSGGQKDFSIQFLDMKGNRIKEINRTNIIDTNSLSEGAYLLKIINNKTHQIQFEKIMIMK